LSNIGIIPRHITFVRRDDGCFALNRIAVLVDVFDVSQHLYRKKYLRIFCPNDMKQNNMIYDVVTRKISICFGYIFELSIMKLQLFWKVDLTILRNKEINEECFTANINPRRDYFTIFNT
jgi:hypothetical protein